MWRAFVAAVVLAGCQQIFGLQQPSVSMLPDDASLGSGVRIGGSVSGIEGAGLVLEDNGGDDHPIVSDGAFVFPSLVPSGGAYDVTVSTEPTNPSETCTVTNGSGTATTDVTNVAVGCVIASYRVGGSVFGLDPGTSVTLANGADRLTVSSNSTFTMPTAVASGTTYSVTVTTQPAAGGPCTPFGGNGTVGNADVTTVVVNCGANAFAVGGTVAGLNGSVTLKDSSNGDTVSISANGTYSFPMLVPSGGTYNVTVMTQPAYPPASQMCTVANSAGTANGNIQNVNISCTTNKFMIGGTVTGLTGTLVLQNNGADDRTLAANGAFNFATSIASGLTYAVTVKSNPNTETCAIASGSGTVKGINVTNVAVTCMYVDPGIRCGSMFCTTPQGCCGPEGTPLCGLSTSCSTQLFLPCDDSVDCGNGKVCCAHEHAQGTRLDSVQCDASCTGSDREILCDPKAPAPCASGACTASTLLPGYYTCQ